MPQSEKGCLYIVATPIGNLGDITQRAVDILGSVDAIAAEDTRHSRKLLQHLGLDTPLFALHEHNESDQADRIVARLASGESIALISDAGTPLISDPGFPLVRRAREAGVDVIPLPGASSLLAALSCSGLPTDRFIFEGFLPAKRGARQNRLQALAREERTVVYFEAPHRIVDCLHDMKASFGSDRPAVLARELTKTFETFLTGTLEDVLARVEADRNQVRGEMVLVIGGYQGGSGIDQETDHILSVLMEELPLKKAAALTAKISGLGKKALYQAGLEKKAGQ